MDTSRIAALLAPFLIRPPQIIGVSGEEVIHSGKPDAGEPAVLSPSQLRNISTYIDILQRWNARVNLTAIRDPEEIVTRHFGESFFTARHLFPRASYVEPAPAETASPGSPDEHCSAAHSEAEQPTPQGFSAAEHRGGGTPFHGQEGKTAVTPPITVADIGSGPGFPGLPIKLWVPGISLTLIESNHKKATFLREVARALTLTDVNIQNARAESLADSSFNVVTLRAVERFETILPIAARLLAPQGRLALLVGSSQVDQALSAMPTLWWPPPFLIPGSRSRVLLIANNGTSEPA